MLGFRSPSAFRPSAAHVAVLFVLLVTAWPLVPQYSGSSAAPASIPPATAHSTPKTTDPAANTKQPAPKRKPAAHASSHAPIHTSSRASRLARTARIKQAFVASSELRPMAQQLALLRTPDAYAGVAAYAR